MKVGTRKWAMAAVCAASAMIVGRAAFAVDVTDADRTYRNFTRETATLRQGQVRVEVRGMTLHDEEHSVLSIAGFRLRSMYGETRNPNPTITPVPSDQVTNPNRVTKVSGGQLDLVTSYGLADNAEIGLIVPGFFETTNFNNGNTIEQQDIGDLQLYGKFQQPVAEHCNFGGGVELSLPNGPIDKGFGTGELGVTPFLSTRYQQGPVALGVNAGYTFYSGSPVAVDNTFLYGAEGIVRVNTTWSFRTEIAGRIFSKGGTQFNDLTILPGIDFKLTDNLSLRPTGLANGTTSALDWGLGLGIAGTL